MVDLILADLKSICRRKDSPLYPITIAVYCQFGEKAQGNKYYLSVP
jgi:hypothetical protein